MRTRIAFSIAAGLALGLAPVIFAQPGAAKGTEALMLDLSKFRTEKFVTDGKTNSFWQTAVGRQVFDGLPFLIEGRGCVYGTKMGPEMRGETNAYPDFIGIQVGRKFDELHLLHVTQWPDVEGREIARIRFNYTDGSKQELPIRFGGHVRDWHRMPSEAAELLTDANTKIVWRAPGVPRIKSTLRLFKTVLANPAPKKEVATMDVVSTKHMAAYDLIAATAANRDASRVVTPPLLPEGPERKFDGTLTVRVTERGSGNPVPGALVQPTMNVDEVSCVCIPFETSATGEGVLRYPSETAKSISLSVEKEGYKTERASAALDVGPTASLEVQMGARPRITGVVQDGAGKALEGVELALWPEWRVGSKTVKSDAQGRYLMIWSPQNNSDSEEEVILVARDLKRNLAFAGVVDEATTNLDLRLEPGLTLAGRATGPNGKTLTNVEAQLSFWTERMGASFGKPTAAGPDGRFEIKALPMGRHYGVGVSAKGYGRFSRDVPKDSEGSRIELEPCELALANLRIAGVVVDADDKAVTNAYLYVSGDNQPSLNARSDSKGRFTFKQVCAGTIQLHASAPTGGYANTTVEGGDTNITVQLASQGGMVASRSSLRLGGVATDPDGKPVPKALVSVFPSHSAAEKPADEEGRFALTYDPNQFSYMGDASPTVVVRDPARNLAAALTLGEDATNASMRLEPGISITGRITDAKGQAITNGQAQVLLRGERMSSNLGAPVRADAGGRFEVRALPPGREYSLNLSAKGFGQEHRNVEGTSTATNQVDLGAVALVLANQLIAGVVLDANDKPVAGASLYSYGEKQPNVSVQTDAKGRFTMAKVCPGPIQLSVNARSGGYAQATAEGGDTNITINISASSGIRRAVRSTPRLQGKPLPDLAACGLTAAQAPAEQPLLAVLIDAEQRPSRRALRLLGEQAASFKDKGLAVVVLQSGPMADDAFKAWKQEAALPFPVGCLTGEAEKARATWGVKALPWFILTDKAHRVTAEGFELEELEAMLKDLPK